MINEDVLKYLSENMGIFRKVERLMRYPDELTYEDLILDLEIDRFRGYEYLLPIIMLATDDTSIIVTCQRLFLMLFSKELKREGSEKTINLVVDILREEKGNCNSYYARIAEIKKG